MRTLPTAACFLTAALAGLPASADMPGVLDHIPGDAAMILLIDNPMELQGKISAFTTAIGQPQAAAQVAMGAGMIMGFPGLDASGTIAAVFPQAFDPTGDVPEPIIILPVTDYAQLVTAFGGTGQGAEAITPPFTNGEEVHVKQLGEGYLVAGSSAEAIEAFGGNGNMATHELHWGAIGDQLGDSDIVAIANIQQMAPTYQPHIDEGFAQLAMLAAMAGPQAGVADPTMILRPIVDNFMRDASVGIIAVDVSEMGLSLDIAANFKQGSELAGLFATGGDSAELMNHLPSMPYLAAGAFDASSEGISTILGELTKMQLSEMGGDIDATMKLLGELDGSGFVVGVSPGGLMGGMLLNTVAFHAGGDSAALLEAAKGAHLATNGMDTPAGKMSTTWEDGAGPNGAAKWTLSMQPDPSSPGAQQMQMANMMMYGATGMPAGFYATSENGIVQTYNTTNPKLLTDSINAADNGGGLGTIASIAAESEHLHHNRVGEVYLAAGEALNTALPMIAMFAGPVNVEVPQDLPPIAASAAINEGGVSGRLWLNSKTIAKLTEVGEAFQGMGDQGGEVDDGPNF